MPDRLGGDAFEGAETAPAMIATGLSAATVRRYLLPAYAITVAVFLVVSGSHVANVLWSVGGQVVWLVLVAVVLRSGWVAYRLSESAAERRFWGSLLAVVVCVGLGQGTYLVELLYSRPAGPPLATLSTVNAGMVAAIPTASGPWRSRWRPAYSTSVGPTTRRRRPARIGRRCR